MGWSLIGLDEMARMRVFKANGGSIKGYYSNKRIERKKEKRIKRISKPGLRVYANKEELPKVLNGLGTAIISTSQGLKTDKEAREAGIGGEVLAYIW